MKKRQKRHSQKALEHMAFVLRTRHKEIEYLVNKEMASGKTYNTQSVHLVRGYDLRATLEEKAIDVHKHHKWTAFVNTRHTLVHLVPNNGDFHVRIPIYKHLKGVSDHYLRGIICKRFWRE